MYLDSLVVTGEGSNGTKVHIAEGLQKKYLALVSYLLGDGLDFLVEEIRRTVQGNKKMSNNILIFFFTESKQHLTFDSEFSARAYMYSWVLLVHLKFIG